MLRLGEGMVCVVSRSRVEVDLYIASSNPFSNSLTCTSQRQAQTYLSVLMTLSPSRTPRSFPSCRLQRMHLDGLPPSAKFHPSAQHAHFAAVVSGHRDLSMHRRRSRSRSVEVDAQSADRLRVRQLSLDWSRMVVVVRRVDGWVGGRCFGQGGGRGEGR